jgi:TRAP-type mannitol/chloroaromatic compound transport system substrate-binding protein
MTGLYSGMQKQQAYDTEAGADQAQAQQAINAASLQMQQKAIQVQQTAGQQGEEYASSGVTLQGTPAEIMAQTRNLGAQEVKAIGNKGSLDAQLKNTQANAAQAAGRASILNGLASDVGTAKSFFI